ncbi:MAG: hypothetical protein HGA78_02765, partial [Nitrospirales bacterium]|nr:hypothetical protein [Nitrospirales bacterium]
MELRVRLKQHTPIIHFQHDQEGATLRATELKPKLDKYIKAKYNIDDKEKLRYQLKIRKISHGPGCVVPERFIRDSMFFGNMGIPPEKHKKEIFSENIELVFNTYFNNSLKNQIEETIPICLALENFGTRNNKGNGCFFIDAKSRSDFENILREALPGRVYYFDCTQNVFFSIKYFYSLLKSGINISTYYKSLIFIYFKEKGDITWDKKIIKNKFLPTVRADSYFTEK